MRSPRIERAVAAIPEDGPCGWLGLKFRKLPRIPPPPPRPPPPPNHHRRTLRRRQSHLRPDRHRGASLPTLAIAAQGLVQFGGILHASEVDAGKRIRGAGLAVDGHRFTGRKIRIAGHRWQSGAGDFAAASSLDQIGCCAEQVEALCATAMSWRAAPARLVCCSCCRRARQA